MWLLIHAGIKVHPFKKGRISQTARRLGIKNTTSIISPLLRRYLLEHVFGNVCTVDIRIHPFVWYDNVPLVYISTLNIKSICPSDASYGAMDMFIVGSGSGLWCISGSLTHGGGENVPGISSACKTRNFAYLVKGPQDDKGNWLRKFAPHTAACYPTVHRGVSGMGHHALVEIMVITLSNVEFLTNEL